MREVQYMTDLAGNRVAVVPGTPKAGFEYDGQVYATREEVNRAKGEADQEAWFDRCRAEAREAIDNILWSILPPPTWYNDDQDKQRGKNDELAGDLMNALFPIYGKRDHYAEAFLGALDNADLVYREMHPDRIPHV